MYVATFYSYKGGVGRSQALMNVAGDLALRGRKVLVVDFDLEAPGLHSYKPFGGRVVSGGIVEFVNGYLDTNEAPKVSNYLIESNDISEGKTFWLMPAGRQDAGYSKRLTRIDWNDLYARNQGFLLFEDLKQQWQDTIAPDYVLIDSRTGHTDVGGICTRHLPDAIVAMMLPNHQNIDGMRQIVAEIRADEGPEARTKKPVHFVLSNVPDLDDEGDILVSMCRKAEVELGFVGPAMTIHHYASLDLLDQAIHTLTRPKTRLANEYRALVNKLARENAADRDGALAWLSEMPAADGPMQWTEMNERIAKILTAHGDDVVVLAAAAHLRATLNDMESAAELFGAAFKGGNRDSVMLMRFAFVLQLLKKNQEATEVLYEVLRLEKSDAISTIKAVKQLVRLQPTSAGVVSSLPVDLATWPAIESLRAENRLEIGDVFLSSGHVATARMLIESWLSSAALPESSKNELVLVAIGSGVWALIVPSLRDRLDKLGRIQDAFNLAMVNWAMDQAPSTAEFARVIEIDKANRASSSAPLEANYLQCIAIANALTGDCATARDQLQLASRLAELGRADQFSAWRYHTVSVHEFLADNVEILSLCDGKSVTPRFFVNRP